MSHTEQVEEHEAAGVLRSLGDLVNSALGHKISKEATAEIERIRQVQRYVGDILRSSEPNLVTIQALDSIADAANHAHQELSMFLATGDENYLQRAQNACDGVLRAAGEIRIASPSESAEATREAVTSFRRSAKQILSDLQKQQSDIQSQAHVLRKQLDAAITELNAQKGRIDAAISEYQQQFSSAEGARSEQFNRTLGDLSGQLNSLMDKQRSRFDDIGQTAQLSFTTLQGTLASELLEVKRVGQEQAGDVIDDLNSMRKQAQELLQVVGNIGMTGDFQKAAISARRRLFVWQTLAVGSIAGLIVFAILAFHSTTQDGFSWAIVATRGFVALAFGILAAFASRQADRSEAAETRNRRYQLELSSIDAYLVSLPVDRRHEVKVRLAEKLFGAIASDAVGDNSKTSRFNGNGLDVIKTTVETIHELVKKK